VKFIRKWLSRPAPDLPISDLAFQHIFETVWRNLAWSRDCDEFEAVWARMALQMIVEDFVKTYRVEALK
jgi:hypothetical protein